MYESKFVYGLVTFYSGGDIDLVRDHYFYPFV